MPLPNLVYIGPDKAGSTWLFQLLTRHPETYITPAKDLYFFDRYFEKGFSWYARQFTPKRQHKVIAEVSHDYLYSPQAAQRMAQHLPKNTRLMVSVREPAERAFSAYLHLLKCGHITQSFEHALKEFPTIIDHGKYGKHLARFLDYFPRSQFLLVNFHTLRNDAQCFADELFRQLAVSPLPHSSGLPQPTLAAATSRSLLVTRVVRRAAGIMRRLGLPGVVGRVKTSPLVQHCLYQRYTPDTKPQMAFATKERLRELFVDDVQRLDNLFQTDFASQWDYCSPQIASRHG